MAGKSTYLRQVALICLLAQCGSYVPCDDAELGIKDSIFTRVGSIDEISQGRSTFMVEMSELANILHSCTDKSLIILDEVGKGTSTNDGVSIAQSTIEHLANDNGYPRPITLFATHYHQLTSLADSIGCVENAHMVVDSSDGEYNFVRKIREGEANNSYGIEVADMAGVPKPVVDRSREILDNIQDEHQNEQ